MKNRFIIFTLLSLFLPRIYCNEIETIELNNKPIRDILNVLGDLTNKNLIIDETIVGTTSYYFSTENIEDALTLFLKSNDLYIAPYDSAFLVSKINVEIDNNDEFSISCKNCNLESILNRLSTESTKTILFDNLPDVTISLNVKNQNLIAILKIILKKTPNFFLEIDPTFFYIKRIDDEIQNNNNSSIQKGIKVNSDGLYSINLAKIRFSNVLDELFKTANYEYIIQGRNDNIIDKINFKNKEFNQILTLILECGSCDYVVSDEIYYIFDINKTEVANKHINTQIIKLKNIRIEQLLKLMPSGFISNNVIKTDESTNSIIVYGTTIKTAPIIDFIKLIDVEKKLIPRWIKMNFITSELFKNLLLKTYNQSNIINVDETSFMILLTEDDFNEVLSLKNKIDIPPNSNLIKLKYLKSEDLIKNLPKSIERDAIILTENPSEIFFYGEKLAYDEFIKLLSLIDKPIPQIKYKVLVLQNTIGDNTAFSFGMDSHSEDNGDISLPENEWSAFSGALGNLLSLNFNVLSAFGPLFSFELNASIQENKTKVLVDTTLQGISGKEISFRNTTTSRFYQTTTDADGETETGAAQEVSWGIILDITGWSSGDGMVTVKVKSTISDETTVSGESSGIPSTSEKIVNTEIRTKEGEPIVIGGLISSKKETNKDKTPILGDIPLLGRLFTKDKEIETQSEFVIYLLPFIEEDKIEGIDNRIEKAYREYVKL